MTTNGRNKGTSPMHARRGLTGPAGHAVGLLVLLAITATGCIKSNSIECSDENGSWFCPSGSVCHDSHHCVLQGQIDQCVDINDGDPCDFVEDVDEICNTGVCIQLGQCGNNLRDASEECDGADLGGGTCVGQGYGGGTLACTASCTYDFSGCTSSEFCGNDTIDLGEACDGTNHNGQTCQTLGQGFSGGTLTCTDACQFDVTACVSETCGNGTLDSGEECDGGDFNGRTCQTEGFAGGQLACSTTSCTLDISGCCECISGACCDGCSYRGTSYVCQANAESQYSCPWGTGCGSDVAVSYRDRYCSGSSASCDGGLGNWSPEQTADTCATSEVCVSGNSTCQYSAPCTCSATDYWNPDLDSDTDSVGQQSSQTLNLGITVNVQETATGELQGQVCKEGGDPFSENIYFEIDDLSSFKAYYSGGTLSTQDNVCSPWVNFSGDTNYSEGEMFGGSWRVISPATSEPTWSSAGCSPSGSSTGTCWNGVNITMTRTCL